MWGTKLSFCPIPKTAQKKKCGIFWPNIICGKIPWTRHVASWKPRVTLIYEAGHSRQLSRQRGSVLKPKCVASCHIATYVVVATPFLHRELKIFRFCFECQRSSNTLSHSRCLNAKQLYHAHLYSWSYMNKLYCNTDKIYKYEWRGGTLLLGLKTQDKTGPALGQ